jgi:hypothetical protein
MSLPLNARFGLDSEPDELDGREYMLLMAALRNQRQYSLGMATRNKDPEAAERNRVNALEIQVLADKLDAARHGTRGLTIKPLRKTSKAYGPENDMQPRAAA